MCAGAIINARIDRVVYGAADPKAGSCGSLTDLFALPYNHHPRWEKGLMEEECGGLLTAFFRSLRERTGRFPRKKYCRPCAVSKNAGAAFWFPIGMSYDGDFVIQGILP